MKYFFFFFFIPALVNLAVTFEWYGFAAQIFCSALFSIIDKD